MWKFTLNLWMLFTVSILLLASNCNALTVKIWPSIIQADQPLKKVILDCSMDDEDRKKFNSIDSILFKDMLFGNTAKVERGKDPTWDLDDVWVSGSKLESPVPDPFLQVTIENVRQSTWYLCHFFGTSKKTNRTYDEIAWGHVAYQNTTPAMEKFIDDFNVMSQRIADMEALQKTKDNVHLAKILMLMMDRLVGCWDMTPHTERMMERQDLALRELERIENTRVMFTAIQKPGESVFRNGCAIVYSNVTVNDGGGYDSRTGYFTPPVSGIYLFQFSMFVDRESFIYVDLKSQDGRTLKRIVVGAQDSWQRFSEGSCVVKLDRKQAVHLSVWSGSASSYRAIEELPNQFAGYLLKASTNTTRILSLENAAPYGITITNNINNN